MKHLVIVESPAKAKTIEGYLGKDFVVKSSYGHIRDLPEKGIGIDVKDKYRPTYEVSSDKKDTILMLKKLADDAELVYLASDDDREGEAISWHLKEALGIEESKTRRIVFREITKNAIVNAIESPRGIDIDLVNAQQARRVLDRLVGYELSPVLWKKIQTGLSAGRVQSVAVRLVVDREREIEGHNSKFEYKIKAIFTLDKGKKLTAELPHKFEKEEEAMTFLEKCIGASFQIKNLEKKPTKRSPAPPFTTSTLQQEASRKLSFSVAQTMSVAQKLYEAGKISYMRTDSVNLSQEALDGAKSAIQTNYGNEYHQLRKYNTKSAGAQEAHEAIRPTNFNASEVDGERNEKRLYELIWKRAIASQMAEAQLEKTVATIGISTTSENLIATGEVIKFDGFLKVYIESTDDEEEEEDGKVLPPLTIGQAIDLEEMKATQRFSRPAPRYTEASLVKKLEEMGIGRPSTYAPTISTVQKRNYVVKENREGRERLYQELILAKDKIKVNTNKEITGAEKSKLFPTNLAMVVNDFLVSNFPNIVDFYFTAKVEKEFDEIAEGRMDWITMLDGFYHDFHDTVAQSETISRKDANSARLLGQHPENGKNMYAKLGKYGAYIQLGENLVEGEEGPKPQYANLKQGQLLESIQLPDALELFKLPRTLGELEEKPMTVAIGKFGPYVKHDSKFYSLGKEDDPYTILEERAVEIIVNKRKADLEKIIIEFNDEVKVLNGRYGPYISFGKLNVKIPKDKKPEELTLEECTQLAEVAAALPPKPKGRFFKKKA